MVDQVPALIKMSRMLESFEAARDRHAIFLSCYQRMTQNILQAAETGFFEDNSWVKMLVEEFAGYYFRAFSSPPLPWQVAFHAAGDPSTGVMTNLVLGINAHINYDLMFALADLLQPEWGQASPETRQSRYLDHCHVNEIIYQTVDEVQDQVIERYEKGWNLVDTLMGPVDEWAISWLISRWREEVWQNTVRYLETPQAEAKAAITTQVETIAADRARTILGRRANREAFQLF